MEAPVTQDSCMLQGHVISKMCLVKRSYQLQVLTISSSCRCKYSLKTVTWCMRYSFMHDIEQCELLLELSVIQLPNVLHLYG